MKKRLCLLCTAISACLCLFACTAEKHQPLSSEIPAISSIAENFASDTAESDISSAEESSAAASDKAASGNTAPSGSSSAKPAGNSSTVETISPAASSSAAATSPAVKPAGRCTVSVSCAEILDNMDKLKTGKEKYVGNGVFLSPTAVDFAEGASAFDVLKGISSLDIDYRSSGFTTKIYYVKGINQIYEKDCGPLSGWVFTVNGKSISVGGSSYKVQNGDIIEWKYTCTGMK